jgi:hypothetical protein
MESAHTLDLAASTRSLNTYSTQLLVFVVPPWLDFAGVDLAIEFPALAQQHAHDQQIAAGNDGNRNQGDPKYRAHVGPFAPSTRAARIRKRDTAQAVASQDAYEAASAQTRSQAAMPRASLAGA